MKYLLIVLSILGMLVLYKKYTAQTAEANANINSNSMWVGIANAFSPGSILGR